MFRSGSFWCLVQTRVIPICSVWSSPRMEIKKNIRVTLYSIYFRSKLLYRCVVYCVPPCRLFQSGCGLNSPQVFKKMIAVASAAAPYMREA